jgi:hypothetical protein
MIGFIHGSLVLVIPAINNNNNNKYMQGNIGTIGQKTLV